jgi:hypothetical protein
MIGGKNSDRVTLILLVKIMKRGAQTPPYDTLRPILSLSDL